MTMHDYCSLSVSNEQTTEEIKKCGQNLWRFRYMQLLHKGLDA